MTWETRFERDSLGPFQVPAGALYGAQTARALMNFPISGRGPDPDFVTATIEVKRAAANANFRLGVLDARLARAIQGACDRILAGSHREQFVIDRFQAGAGTSHHMNANEVIANLANLDLGGELGSYSPVHPNDHVNRSQSTNDVIPTAIRLALLAKLPRLTAAVSFAAEALAYFAEQEAGTLKAGRTHLQDAVPTTFGQEFGGYAFTVREQVDRLEEAATPLSRLGLGGSAAGTGLNTPQGYPRVVVEELVQLTGRGLSSHPNLTSAMQSLADLAHFSSQLRELAGELGRISNDIRLLASGPRTGLAEVQLPAVQPGSSIMPGKVNPVMFEMLNQTLFQVQGQDHAVQAMAQAGQLELNVMMPALGSALFDAMEWATAAIKATTERGLRGMTTNRERSQDLALASVSLATLLNQLIGYDRAGEIAKEAERSGRSMADLVEEKGLLSRTEFEQMVTEAARKGSIQSRE